LKETDILTLTETWLEKTSGIKDKNFIISQTKSGRFGGVLNMIRKSHKPKIHKVKD
jgi:hypothetical protein